MDDKLVAARDDRGDGCEYNLKICSGKFRNALRSEFILLPLSVIMALVCFLICYARVRGEMPDFLGIFPYVAGLFGFVFCGVVPIIYHGKSLYYDFSQNVFSVGNVHGKKKEQRFYYSEIIEVKHETLSLYGIRRGYKVTVVTKIKTVTYRYICGSNKAFTDTPFYWLMHNVAIANNEKQEN